MQKLKTGIKQLSDKLNILNGVIGGNSVLPILETYLMEVKGNELKITVTDMQNTMTTTMPVESYNDFKICIPAKILSETIKILPDQTLEITVNENFGIELNCNQGRYKMVGEDPNDFPKIEDIEGKEIMLESAEIEEVLKSSLFSISDDDLRPAMTGLFFQFTEDNKLNFVSTDASRLTKIEMNIETEPLDDFIVPKKSLSILKNSLKDTDIFIKTNGTNVVFRYDENVLICRLIDAKFPQYEAIIPVNENVVKVSKIELLNALKRVSIFSNKTTFMTVMDFSTNQVQLSTQDLDFNNEAKEVIENIDYTGPEIKIGFNSKFIIEILQNLDIDIVTIQLNDNGQKPALFKSEENVIMLAMPMAIV